MASIESRRNRNLASLFRHFKGKSYRYVGTAKHSETLDDFVVYEALYDNPAGKLWIRPKAMFDESIERDGVSIRRFAPVPVAIEIVDVRSQEFMPKLRQIAGLCASIFPSRTIEVLESRIARQDRAMLVMAFIDRSVVGFKLGHAEDRDTFYSWLGGVETDYRGLGIASALLVAQHSWCKEQLFKRIKTQVRNSYREMIGLNLKSGFDIIGCYLDKRREPKVILEKRI